MVGFPILIWSLITRMAFTSFFMVDGPSMDPTLKSGQLFLVDQYTYTNSEPKRDDVVVFSFEEEPDYYYVKRVVGLPGEKVSVENDGVYLHFAGGGEQKLDEPFLPFQTQEAAGSYWKKSAAKSLFDVPSDKYFVLGDNRSHSLDSRYFSDHYVPRERIKGKYLFTIF
jgi:signal peptidase I